MNASQDTKEHRQWYTRRADTVRGPYPTDHITRYVLLGRIRLTDELSQDRCSWQPVIECTGILPEEFSGLSSWDDYQRLMQARIRVDERKRQRRQGERHAGQPNSLTERRRGPERRQAHRNIESLVSHFLGSESGDGNRQQTSILRALLLAALLLSLLVAWFSTTFR